MRGMTGYHVAASPVGDAAVLTGGANRHARSRSRFSVRLWMGLQVAEVEEHPKQDERDDRSHGK